MPIYLSKGLVFLRLALGAILLATPWLVPNHQLPWVAFHSDAAAGLVWLVIATLIIVKLKPEAEVCKITLIALAALMVIGLQFFVGVIFFSGSALLNSLYVIGFYLVFVCAKKAEQVWPGQLLDLLFSGIALAAVVSVGLQLTQWLELVPDGLTDIWIMNLLPLRPSGNLGHPNQLASLLIWGVIAFLWARNREQLGFGVLFVGMLWLGLGLVMAQSRSAFVALFIMGLVLLICRKLWRRNDAIVIVAGSGLLLLLGFQLMPLLADALLLERPTVMLARSEGEVRFSVWKMFFDASFTSPWIGFGWNEVLQAQMEVIFDHPKLVGRAFAHTHNLFLDLIIWTGWPIGLILICAVMYWLQKAARQIRSVKALLVFLPIVTIGVHAMVELPLHYAYFLLPTGFFIGAAAANCQLQLSTLQNAAAGTRYAVVALWMYVCALLSVVIFDYFKAEEEFYLLRFEGARIGNLSLGKVPDVVVLNQLGELIRFARFEAKTGMTAREIHDSEQITLVYPSLSNLFKMAQINALNKDPEKAELWLRKACAMLGEGGCSQAKYSWVNFRRDHSGVDIAPFPTAVLGE